MIDLINFIFHLTRICFYPPLVFLPIFQILLCLWLWSIQFFIFSQYYCIDILDLFDSYVTFPVFRAIKAKDVNNKQSKSPSFKEGTLTHLKTFIEYFSDLFKMSFLYIVCIICYTTLWPLANVVPLIFFVMLILYYWQISPSSEHIRKWIK